MDNDRNPNRSRLSWGLTVETERARSLLALIAIIVGGILAIVIAIVVAIVTR